MVVVVMMIFGGGWRDKLAALKCQQRINSVKIDWFVSQIFHVSLDFLTQALTCDFSNHMQKI